MVRKRVLAGDDVPLGNFGFEDDGDYGAADGFLSGSGKSAKFATIGTTHVGKITAEPEVKQQTEFGTGMPLTWNDGSPRMQLVIPIRELDVESGEDADVSLYCKGNMKQAVTDALRRVGVKGLRVGGHISVTYTGNDVPKTGKQAAKKYQAEYKPPAPRISPF